MLDPLCAAIRGFTARQGTSRKMHRTPSRSHHLCYPNYGAVEEVTV